MAKAYHLEEITALGVSYYAEEKNHSDIVECQSGNFAYCNLIFSGCETVGDFFAWCKDKSNHLTIRYWDSRPTEDERAVTEWTPYILHRKGERDVKYLTETDFQNVKARFVPKEIDPLYQYTLLEYYVSQNDTEKILLPKV